jgi:hypothetical protein
MKDYKPSAHLVGYQPERQIMSPADGKVALRSFLAALFALVVLNVAFPDPAPVSCARPQMASIDVK